MNHATWPARVILIVISAVIVWTVIAAQRGKKLFIRRIPGLTAIDEAVGRAAVLMGIQQLFSPDARPAAEQRLGREAAPRLSRA